MPTLQHNSDEITVATSSMLYMVFGLCSTTLGVKSGLSSLSKYARTSASAFDLSRSLSTGCFAPLAIDKSLIKSTNILNPASLNTTAGFSIL
jgi:hypothetical protein